MLIMLCLATKEINATAPVGPKPATTQFKELYY